MNKQSENKIAELQAKVNDLKSENKALRHRLHWFEDMKDNALVMASMREDKPDTVYFKTNLETAFYMRDALHHLIQNHGWDEWSGNIKEKSWLFSQLLLQALSLDYNDLVPLLSKTMREASFVRLGNNPELKEWWERVKPSES